MLYFTQVLSDRKKNYILVIGPISLSTMLQDIFHYINYWDTNTKSMRVFFFRSAYICNVEDKYVCIEKNYTRIVGQA